MRNFLRIFHYYIITDYPFSSGKDTAFFTQSEYLYRKKDRSQRDANKTILF